MYVRFTVFIFNRTYTLYVEPQLYCFMSQVRVNILNAYGWYIVSTFLFIFVKLFNRKYILNLLVKNITI